MTPAQFRPEATVVNGAVHSGIPPVPLTVDERRVLADLLETKLTYQGLAASRAWDAIYAKLIDGLPTQPPNGVAV